MFESQVSKTVNQKLEDVLSRLKLYPSVEAVLLMGSAANHTMHAHSDYDLACVVRDIPKNILGINTFIDNTFTEVFFYSSEEVELALKKKTADLSTKEGWIINWSRDGKIVLDRSGLLTQLKEKSGKMMDQVSDTLTYQSWHRLNYNLVQNARYFRSENELYLQALDVKLSFSIVEALVGYFHVRKVSWKGEKEAIRWLKEHDENFLRLFQSFFVQTDRSKKMHVYENVVKAVLEPIGGVWQGPVISIVPTGEIDQNTIQSGLKFWDNLITI
ncbi:MAG: nucleotidyltransferase domain-containing protein [Candidatus Uhrbacteria bacterium]|nr:nucleotidyltransferase domain-containing protein [Candidatus Uhrbacteria bacterium]